jgi:branched-chain amino acid transport system ATP-binding protein
MSMQPLLKVEGLSMRFGGLLAVNNVALTLKEGEIVSLIGPNGAGKTTVFNCLTGFYRPTSGTIKLRERHLEGLPGQAIARMGVVRTFQHVRLFREMTVIENLLVAQHQHLKSGVFAGLLKTPAFRRAEADALERASVWLQRVGLLEMANRSAGNLAYGQQRRLEIVRCMVTRPELLMLDEPAAGLNPKETDELDHLIVELRNQHKVSVLLIEHDMKLVMGISDRIYVVNQGTPLAQGTPAEIRNNPDVIRAYLGESFMLSFNQVSAHYGKIQALHQVSLNIKQGEIVTLIGANGAGKTTLLGTLCGEPRASEGSITFLDQDITQWQTSRIMREAVAIVPEGRRVFSRMTVEENLAMGGFFADRHQYQQRIERVFGLFPRLLERRTQRSGTMSGGEQQMLAIGRALMSQPKLLLLDEPSLGLAPIIIQQIFDIIQQLREEGMTIFLVEQNANQALKLADRGYVLENGRVVLEDTGAELLANEAVRSAYLGG